MKVYKIFILLLFVSPSSLAAGWTGWAVPTRVDVERGNGVLIHGGFGNPNSCGRENQVYIPATHPQYEQVFGLVMLAFSAQKPIQIFAYKCGKVGWYTSNETAFNIADNSAVNIRH